MKAIGALSVVLVLVFLVIPANADLYVRGTGTIDGISGEYQLIYDDVLDITWLDYSSSPDHWFAQTNWASTIVVDFGGEELTEWRLPFTDESVLDLGGGWGCWGPDGEGNYDYFYGYNMVNSEMGHLFYETLGNTGYYGLDGTNPPADWGFTDIGPFENLEDELYWSSTEYSPSTPQVYVFHFWLGIQRNDEKVNDYYAIAVMDGDVGAVPIPASFLLLGSGIFGLGVLRRRRC